MCTTQMGTPISDMFVSILETAAASTAIKRSFYETIIDQVKHEMFTPEELNFYANELLRNLIKVKDGNVEHIFNDAAEYIENVMVHCQRCNFFHTIQDYQWYFSNS